MVNAGWKPDDKNPVRRNWWASEITRDKNRYNDRYFQIFSHFPKLPFLRFLHLNRMPALISIENRSLSSLPQLEGFYCSDNPILVQIDKNVFSYVNESIGEGEMWPPLTTVRTHADHFGIIWSRARFQFVSYASSNLTAILAKQRFTLHRKSSGGQMGPHNAHRPATQSLVVWLRESVDAIHSDATHGWSGWRSDARVQVSYFGRHLLDTIL